MKSLHYAAFKGRFDSLRIQIEDDPNININERDDKNMTPLHHACLNGHIDIVKLLLTKKARTDCRQNSNHATPLHLASKHGHLEIVKCLLEFKNSVNDKMLNGYTALHLAAEKGHSEIAKHLITKGAEIDAESDEKHITPLMLAIQKGHLNIACSIIDQLDDDFIDELSFGKNPLHAIIKRSNHEDQNAIRLIQILCRTDIYIYQLDKNNFTPLALAVKLNKPNLVELLIDKDANPNDAYGNTPPPLIIAIQYCHPEIVKLLLQNGADLELREPLRLAIKNVVKKTDRDKNLQIIKYLIEHGADVNDMTDGMEPLFHTALKTKCEDLVHILLKNGVDINTKDSMSNNPLHVAISTKQRNLAIHLLAIQPEIHKSITRNHQGKTPFDLAKELGQNEILQLILKRMKNKTKMEMDKEEAEKSNQRAKRMKLDDCIICYNPRDQIFVLDPCGHAKTCETCCLKILNLPNLTIPSCPVCRKRVFY